MTNNIAATFLERAKEYSVALDILSGHLRKATVAPMGLLASQAIELALKAYLLHAGESEKTLRNIGHDLRGAWDAAFSKGLRIKTDHRFSVDLLSLSHDSPYLFRYPQEKIAVGITPPEVLSQDVASIIHAVEEKLGN